MCVEIACYLVLLSYSFHKADANICVLGFLCWNITHTPHNTFEMHRHLFVCVSSADHKHTYTEWEKQKAEILDVNTHLCLMFNTHFYVTRINTAIACLRLCFCVTTNIKKTTFCLMWTLLLMRSLKWKMCLSVCVCYIL